MKVYVLSMLDCMSRGNTISEVLGVFKTKALAQKGMRRCVRCDIDSAKEQGLCYEVSRGDTLTTITYDEGEDFIEYTIDCKEVTESL